MSKPPPNPRGAPEAERIEERIVIERDGSVVVRSGKVEYGQGIRTGFARIVAEELDVSITRVRVELGETDRVPWDMGTFASMSTAVDGPRIRAAAAGARRLLLERAAALLSCAVSQLATRDGRVKAPDGREASYEELTAAQPLTGEVPENVSADRGPTPSPDAPLRIEARDILTGRARFTADVRLPGMLRGHVLHPPAPGARLATLDDRAACTMPGVVAVVRNHDFVGIVAERSEQVLAAVRALQADWQLPDQPPVQPTAFILRRDQGVDRALAEESTVLHARYEVPHIAHASIGPSAAVADVRPDEVDLYVTTQRPFADRDDVAELLGVRPERVHVHPQVMTGVYGRANMNDAMMDAARLSRAVHRPVLVQWTREEEFGLSPCRPTLDARLSAALDAKGGMVGWRSHTRTNFHLYGAGAVPPRVVEITSGRNAVPPYRLGAAEVLLDVVPATVRTGAFRSPRQLQTSSRSNRSSMSSRTPPGRIRSRSGFGTSRTRGCAVCSKSSTSEAAGRTGCTAAGAGSVWPARSTTERMWPKSPRSTWPQATRCGSSVSGRSSTPAGWSIPTAHATRSKAASNRLRAGPCSRSFGSTMAAWSPPRGRITPWPRFAMRHERST